MINITAIVRVVATVTLLQAGTANAVSSQAHWGYTGHNGPDNWGQLSEKFTTCSAGRNQSPINITDSVNAELAPIQFAYQSSPIEILNNGHTVQVNVAPGSSITLDGHQFELKQYHFHTPSENLIEGQSFPLEGHLVHADSDGNLAVLAVMFQSGATNTELAQLWEKMPEKAGETRSLDGQARDLMELLPESKAYYRFNGSLTTPPCTEGVRWLVLKQPVSLAEQQVKTFAAIVHHRNNRPVQPLNSRLVLK